jgi:hypothetical protein
LLKTTESISEFQEVLSRSEGQDRKWMAVIHWDDKQIKKPFLAAGDRQHSSWANGLWHDEYREVWCSLLPPSARMRWEDAGGRTYVPQSIQLGLERDILSALPPTAILSQLPLPSALLATEVTPIRAIHSQRVLYDIVKVIDALFLATLPHGVDDRYRIERAEEPAPIRIAAHLIANGTYNQGDEIEITDEGEFLMRARVYRLPGHPNTPYFRIPVPTRHDLCGIFALGMPPNGVTAYDIVTLLQRYNLVDHTIVEDHPIWKQIANLYGARIVMYREDVIDGRPTVTRTWTIVPDRRTDGQRTLRIIGEPGHYNALVPIADTNRIREFMRLNAEQADQGWYPLFRLESRP